ncbi:MAG: hypothetical protein HY892_20730, partial [Deltaproteobacteria bacterium]|nr:hypothetical protein [Deltaproteobacteria bacterium]
MPIPFLLLGFLYFAAVFFGGVHLWSQSVLVLEIFGTALVLLWPRWLAGRLAVRDLFACFRDPACSLGGLFLIWAAFSLVPLPAAVLRLISPATYGHWAAAALAGGTFPRPLSLYPYVTWNSLTFGTALLGYYGL